ncbi:DUF2470 domain-containing protein [Hoyosella altamirensis]|uniref:DUF2470 domain-containing protein n=1 Tax=Hoyosella altamirensis TaxID=616997 RepID=A0A839RPF0_9ACTN|nr:DUF2470 domain-containing protein [Hoyosella altamirensis]MBB3037994.1 hypothetical protein [Hoyosella altamirensis]
MAHRSPGQYGPNAAERVRSAFSRARTAVLALDGTDPVATSVHHFDGVGGMIIAVPEDCAATALAWQACTAGMPAVLELTDEAPVELREPVRALVWIRGQLFPIDPDALGATAQRIAATSPHIALLDVGHGLTLLRLEVTSTVVADHTGAEAVPIDALAAAEPDPFCHVETCWLRHLDSDHTDMLAMITRKLPASTRSGTIRPLGLDRYGLRLRVEHSDASDNADQDIRIAFPAPVSTPDQLSQALRILMGCPFLNGIRARGL